MAPNSRTNGDQARPLCFAIGPYGDKGTLTREWSDFLFTKVIEPVLKEDYVVQRTIDCPEPGQISARIKRDLNDARLVIADLTDANPNAYFELGYRHALARPFIHLARTGTKLPFDIANFEVGWIQADYVKTSDTEGYYTIRDDNLNSARSALRGQLDRISDGPAPPTDPFSAKVYRWEMVYSSSIAIDWLEAQPEPFREQISSYERGGGSEPIADRSLALFAEYLALKSAASQSGEGTIFMTVNNLTGRLDFGCAAFKFSGATEPILINVKDVSCSGQGVASISFDQSSRAYPIERGGRMMNVMIPGYKYTLKVECASKSDGGALGTILHPRTNTKIGDAELTPRYGQFLD